MGNTQWLLRERQENVIIENFDLIFVTKAYALQMEIS